MHANNRITNLLSASAITKWTGVYYIQGKYAFTPIMIYEYVKKYNLHNSSSQGCISTCYTKSFLSLKQVPARSYLHFNYDISVSIYLLSASVCGTIEKSIGWA